MVVSVEHRIDCSRWVSLENRESTARDHVYIPTRHARETTRVHPLRRWSPKDVTIIDPRPRAFTSPGIEHHSMHASVLCQDLWTIEIMSVDGCNGYGMPERSRV